LLFVINHLAAVGVEVRYCVFVVVDADSFTRVELVLELLAVVELDINEVAHSLGVHYVLLGVAVLAARLGPHSHFVFVVYPDVVLT